MISRNIWTIIIFLLGGLVLISAYKFAQPSTTATAMRQPEAEFPRNDEHWYFRVLFTPDGTQVVGYGSRVNTKEGVVDFWDVGTRRLLRTITQPRAATNAVFTPDGKRLVTCDEDGKMHLFETPDWAPKYVIDTGLVRRLVMLPDGRRFITAGYHSRSVRIWELDKRKAIPLGSKGEYPSGMAASKDGKRFAISYTGHASRGTEIWDAQKLKIVGEIPAGSLSVALSPDGKWIATGSQLVTLETSVGSVSLWDATTFQKHKDLPGTTESPRAIGFTNDSKLLICCMGADSEVPEKVPAKVCIWSTATGKLVHQFAIGKTTSTEFALSPDDRWLVITGDDSPVRLWDFGKIRREIGQ